MSDSVLFTNDAISWLITPVATGDTTVTVGVGDGAKFPAPVGGQYFVGVLEDLRNGAKEYLKVTGRTGDMMSVVRAQEGTLAQAFTTGSTFSLRMSAGAISALLTGVSDISLGKVNRAGDTMTGALTLFGPPTAPLHAATKAFVESLTGNTYTKTEADARYVNAAGDLMTGSLTVAPAASSPVFTLNRPTTGTSAFIVGQTAGVDRWQMIMPLNAEPGDGTGGDFLLRGYTDDASGNTQVLTINRGTWETTLSSGFTDNLATLTLRNQVPLATRPSIALLRLWRSITGSNQGVSIDVSNTNTAGTAPYFKINFFRGSGATTNYMSFDVLSNTTGPVTIPALTLYGDGTIRATVDPINALDLATKRYVDGVNTVAIERFVDTAGDTMSGALTLFGDPALPLHAVTKRYADAHLLPAYDSTDIDKALTVTQGHTQFEAVAPGLISPPTTLTRDHTIDTAQATALSVDGVNWTVHPENAPRFHGTAQRLLIEGARTNGIRNPRFEGGTPGLLGSTVLVSPGFLNPAFAVSRSQPASAKATSQLADGSWAEVTANLPRFTGPNQRLLVEGARTNSIPNPRGEGAVAGLIGSGGAVPTGWVISGIGVDRIVSAGTVNGMQFVDIKVEGTPTSGTSQAIQFVGTTVVPAAPGQIWTGSVSMALIAGDLTNLAQVRFRLWETGGSSGTAQIGSLLTSALQRFVVTRTLGAGTTHVYLTVDWTIAVGMPINATFRFAWPQLELGDFASTPILPAVGTPAAATRGEDRISATLASLSLPATGACTIAAKALRTTNTVGAVQPLFHVDDGGTANRYYLQGLSASGNHTASRTNAGITNGSPQIVGPAAGTLYNVGLRVDGAGNTSGFITGSTVQSVAGGVVAGLTHLRLGCSSGAGFPYWGEIESVVVTPAVLSDTAFASFVDAGYATAPAAPTNVTLGAVPAGLACEYRGTFVVNGVSVMRLKFTGTAPTGANFPIYFDAANAIPALNGQTWVHSLHMSRTTVGGTTTLAPSLRAIVYDSSFAALTTYPNLVPPLTAALARFDTGPLAVTDPTAAFIRPYINATIADGAAYDTIIEFGWPQLAQGGAATTPILPPVGAPQATTRGPDIVAMPLTNAVGTITARFLLPVTNTSGASKTLLLMDGGVNDHVLVSNPTGGNVLQLSGVRAGVAIPAVTIGSMTPGTAFDLVVRTTTAGTSFASLNGGAEVSIGPVNVQLFAVLRIGSSLGGSLVMDGQAERVTVAPDPLYDLSLDWVASIDTTARAAAAAASANADTRVLKAGDTMTGALTLAGAPTSALHASTKQFVETSAFTASPGAVSLGTYTFSPVVTYPPGANQLRFNNADVRLATLAYIRFVNLSAADIRTQLTLMAQPGAQLLVQSSPAAHHKLYDITGPVTLAANDATIPVTLRVGSSSTGFTSPVAVSLRSSPNVPTEYRVVRTMPDAVDDCVDIGTWLLEYGAVNLEVTIAVSGLNFSMSANHHISSYYGNYGWHRVAPTTQGTAYPTGFQLEALSAGHTLQLRLRRTGATTAGTAVILLRDVGHTGALFTPSTTVTAAAPAVVTWHPGSLVQIVADAPVTTATPYSPTNPPPVNYTWRDYVEDGPGRRSDTGGFGWFVNYTDPYPAGSSDAGRLITVNSADGWVDCQGVVDETDVYVETTATGNAVLYSGLSLDWKGGGKYRSIAPDMLVQVHRGRDRMRVIALDGTLASPALTPRAIARWVAIMGQSWAVRMASSAPSGMHKRFHAMGAARGVQAIPGCGVGASSFLSGSGAPGSYWWERASATPGPNAIIARDAIKAILPAKPVAGAFIIGANEFSVMQPAVGGATPDEYAAKFTEFANWLAVEIAVANFPIFVSPYGTRQPTGSVAESAPGGLRYAQLHACTLRAATKRGPDWYDFPLFDDIHFDWAHGAEYGGRLATLIANALEGRTEPGPPRISAFTRTAPNTFRFALARNSAGTAIVKPAAPAGFAICPGGDRYAPPLVIESYTWSGDNLDCTTATDDLTAVGVFPYGSFPQGFDMSRLPRSYDAATGRYLAISTYHPTV